jgi:hypothetical protein
LSLSGGPKNTTFSELSITGRSIVPGCFEVDRRLKTEVKNLQSFYIGQFRQRGIQRRSVLLFERCTLFWQLLMENRQNKEKCFVTKE